MKQFFIGPVKHRKMEYHKIIKAITTNSKLITHWYLLGIGQIRLYTYAMVYLIDSFDFDLIRTNAGGQFMNFTLWETTEDRIKRIIANERCRSIFSRNEIINLFKTGKIQMVKCQEIVLKQFDRIVVWTKTNRYFVIEITSFDKINETTFKPVPIFNRPNRKQQKAGEKLARQITRIEERVGVY